MKHRNQTVLIQIFFLTCALYIYYTKIIYIKPNAFFPFVHHYTHQIKITTIKEINTDTGYIPTCAYNVAASFCDSWGLLKTWKLSTKDVYNFFANSLKTPCAKKKKKKKEEKAFCCRPVFLISYISMFELHTVLNHNSHNYYYYSQLLYSAIHCSWADSLCMSHVILNEWLQPFTARIINIHGSGVLVALFGCCMAGATWNAAVSAWVLCTPFNHAPVYSDTSFKAT